MVARTPVVHNGTANQHEPLAAADTLALTPAQATALEAALSSFTVADLQNGTNLTAIVHGQVLDDLIEIKATEQTGFGENAGVDAPGNANTSVGRYTFYQGLGSAFDSFGAHAGQYSNAGCIYVQAIGGYSLYNAVDTYYTQCVGHNCGYALKNTYGAFIGGHSAGQDGDNLDHSVLLGLAAGQLGKDVVGSVGVGYYSLLYGTAAYATAIGVNSAQSSQSTYGTYVGGVSGYGDRGTGNVYLGYASYQDWEATVVPVTATLPSTLNWPAHGLAVGQRVLVQLQATTNPAPLVTPIALTVEALTANTVKILGQTLTSVGAGLTVRKVASFNNSVAIGYASKVTASNQVWLGNSSTTEVRSAGTFYGAGFTVVSDRTLKRDIAAIPDEVAIAFSRAVDFVSFVRIQDMNAVRDTRRRQNELIRAQIDELQVALDQGVKTDTGVIPLATGKKAGLRVRIRELRAQLLDVKQMKEQMFGGTDAGVIAQDVRALAEKLGYGQWLVKEDSDGKLAVNFPALLAVVAKGFQLRLAQAGF